MNDKELADKIVELGIGSERFGYYSPSVAATGFLCETQRAPAWFEATCMPPEKFVRDWQVAGALMEKLTGIDIDLDQYGETAVGLVTTYGVGKVSNAYVYDSLPRAICEAVLPVTDPYGGVSGE